MARPERNTVDYFPFLCDEGKKMFYIEETYGNDGFAVFIKILRELAKTDYHYLNLSQKTTSMFLAAKCKVSNEKLELIINDLVELEKFDKDLWLKNRIIWCQDFIDSIQDAYKKRNNECITFEGLRVLLTGLGVLLQDKLPITEPVKPQRKVNKRKEDKTKENNHENFNFLKELINIGITEKTALSWIKVRKEKGGVNTDIAFESIKKQIELTTGVAPNDCIKLAVEKSWSGYKAEWYFNEMKKNNYGTEKNNGNNEDFDNGFFNNLKK